MTWRNSEWPKVTLLLLAVILGHSLPGSAEANSKADQRYWQELCERNELRADECPRLKSSHKPLHGLMPSWLDCGKKGCTVTLWVDAPRRDAALLRRMREYRNLNR